MSALTDAEERPRTSRWRRLCKCLGWTALGFLGLLLATQLYYRAMLEGYSVKVADTGKAWLMKPDGTYVHGMSIEGLYSGEDQLLLIVPQEKAGAQTSGPAPLEADCLVALLIDTNTNKT